METSSSLPTLVNNSEPSPNVAPAPFYMPGENQDPISRFSSSRMHLMKEPPCKSTIKNPGGGINGEYIYSQQKIYDLEVAKQNHHPSIYGKEKYGLKAGSDGIQELRGMQAMNPPIRPFGPMTRNNLFFSNIQKQVAYGVNHAIWETTVPNPVTVNSTDTYETNTMYDIYNELNRGAVDYLRPIQRDLLEVGDVRDENLNNLNYSAMIGEIGPNKPVPRELDSLREQIIQEHIGNAYIDLNGNIHLENNQGIYFE